MDEIIIFVDMDGVIADYNYVEKLEFRNKRPLKNNINVFEEISCLSNVELRILSVCRKIVEIKDKNDWLDENASFFDKDKRVVLAREKYNNELAKNLKYNYLKEFVNDCDKKVILIDDDNEIIKLFRNSNLGIDVYQDSILVD